MKKILSTLLSFTLLLSASFTFAENNTEEMERLLVSVKSRIDDTEGYTEFSSNSYSSEYGTTYDFSWSHSDDKYYKSLNVSCNSEGIITYYSAYDSSKSNREKALSITGTKRAEALTVATEKVKQLNPDIAHSLVVSDSESFESFRNDGFSFLIQRYENGIPVLYDTGRIYLNADCSLNNFYLNYTTGLSFESNENKISKANAASLYNSNIGLDLYYISSYDYPDNHTAELVYSQKNDNKYIHAVTGEVYEIKENYEAGYSNNAKLEESVTMDSAAGGLSYRKQLSDAELKTVLEVENLLSDSDVDEIIKSFDFLGIPDDITLNSSSFYYNNSLKTYIYNLTYKTDTNQVADVNINAQTGEILYFYKWNDIPHDAVADQDKINVLSEEIITALAKEKAAEFRKTDSINGSDFSGMYKRYINDIPFNENTISLAFDHEYNLTRYSISYYDMEFPTPENIILSDEAFKSMDALGEYKIYYIKDLNAKKFVPVYHFSEGHTIDAHTGKSIYSGSDDISGGSYTDISGHYAEEEIKTLSSYGIFLDGTELKPDEAITQKDYVALLSVIFYSGDISVLRSSYDSESLYKTLPNTFFLEKDIDPTAHLTRATAAKLMVRAMGAEEYAELSDIYAPLYNDVSQDIGYINILTGFGVVSGDGSGSFNPDAEITRAQALIMIYNYLSR